MLDRLSEIRTAPMCLVKHPHERYRCIHDRVDHPLICELPVNHRSAHESRLDDGRVIRWSPHVTMEIATT